MKTISDIGLSDVQAVYSGPEWDLWELVMGQQIHIGGLQSSLALVEKAGVGEGMTGVDLCCCTGAGMRFLLRFADVKRMVGVDATTAVIARGRERCIEEGVAEQVEFVLADSCATELPEGMADFVWGEDAWCYVADKPKLVAEAARLVKSGGVVAFTDWVEGPAGLSDEEATRLLRFMKFPNLASPDDYASFLAGAGCDVVVRENTGRFAPYMDLYLNMLGMQLTYDALRIIGFDQTMFQGLAVEMEFLRQLAHAGKIAQVCFVAKKR